MKISILTPTYNRANLLKNLYKSILENCTNCKLQVEWLIMDDGSKDETKLMVERFISDKKLETNNINSYIELEKQNKYLMSEKISYIESVIESYIFKDYVSYNKYYNDTIKLTYKDVLEEVSNMVKKDIFFYRGTKK